MWYVAILPAGPRFSKPGWFIGFFSQDCSSHIVTICYQAKGAPLEPRRSNEVTSRYATTRTGETSEFLGICVSWAMFKTSVNWTLNAHLTSFFFMIDANQYIWGYANIYYIYMYILTRNKKTMIYWWWNWVLLCYTKYNTFGTVTIHSGKSYIDQLVTSIKWRAFWVLKALETTNQIYRHMTKSFVFFPNWGF